MGEHRKEYKIAFSFQTFPRCTCVSCTVCMWKNDGNDGVHLEEAYYITFGILYKDTKYAKHNNNKVWLRRLWKVVVYVSLTEKPHF